VAKVRKRFQRIINNPVGVKWDELKTVLEHYGCIVKKGSKHWIVFHSLSNRNITVSVHDGRVKIVYVKELIDLLEEVLEEDED